MTVLRPFIQNNPGESVPENRSMLQAPQRHAVVLMSPL